MSLIDQVRRTLQREQLTTSHSRVVAALSGGPDSVALAHILATLHDEGLLQFVALAHMNHGLRAAAADDARFCADVAARLGRPFILEDADVRALAAAEQRSLEDAAHVARYAFFDRVAEAQRADAIAVGHTRDDQAETFLLRLVRGAGARGLASMHPRSGIVIRPMLDCSRADVHAFLNERGLQAVHDESNDDVGIPRNRVRAELLPLLQSRFNPSVVDALAAAAELSRSDESLLQEQALAWLELNAKSDAPGTWTVEAADLLSLPRAIGWRVLHSLMSRLSSPRAVGFDDVRRASNVAEGVSKNFDGPGQRVERVGSSVVLSSRPAGSAGRRSSAVSSSQVPAFSRPLPIPGEVAIPEIGCVMSAEIALSAQSVSPTNGAVAVVPKSKVAGGLAVRNRRPGDRLMPSPAGHRKLQDVLVDRKVPRTERDKVPIVVDASDRIVWVAGHVLDREFRVVDPAQAVVILRLKAVGGPC